MEARELRIGNLVFSPYDNKAIQVNGTDIFMLEVEHHRELKFKPIPISDEWLKHIGFQISDDSYSDGNHKPANYKEAFYGENPVTKDYLLMLKNVGDGWFYRNGYFKIDYLHQIQNLHFALTNKEIKIIQK